MKVTWQDETMTGGKPGRKTITITVEPSDDPHGHINGLLLRERLEAFLVVFANASNYPADATAEDIRDLLLRFGYVANATGPRLDGLLLAARDQFGLGWGTIANALDRPRTTVKERIVKLRREHAAMGAYYDADGLHLGDTKRAQELQAGREVTSDRTDRT